MGDVVQLNMETRLPVPVECVLKGATDAELASVIIIGTTEAGDVYHASSLSLKPEMLWMIERFKREALGL